MPAEQDVRPGVAAIQSGPDCLQGVLSLCDEGHIDHSRVGRTVLWSYCVLSTDLESTRWGLRLLCHALARLWRKPWMSCCGDFANLRPSAQFSTRLLWLPEPQLGVPKATLTSD